MPVEQIAPTSVFEKVGVDYAGPFLVQYGHVRKPTIVKSYICLFAYYVKAVHLELVSDLTTETFIAALHQFISRRICPSLTWSDHGTNLGKNSATFCVVNKLKGLFQRSATARILSGYLFLGRHLTLVEYGSLLWRSAKLHLSHMVGSVKLTFEEFSAILTQVVTCLNSHPLIPVSTADDGIEILTPGHFLIGKPLAAFPDPSFSYRSIFLLHRWNLSLKLLPTFGDTTKTYTAKVL